MAKNPMMKLLTAPDKGVGQTYGSNGVLARLFRTILFDEDVTPYRYMDLMDAFIREGQSGIPVNRVDLTSWRGNLTKELGKDQMSWKVFCKALRFLQACKIEFSLKITWRSGKVTRHKTEVDLGTPEAMVDVLTPDTEENEENLPPFSLRKYMLPLDELNDEISDL